MNASRQRDTGIDILRAIFVFTMVTAHVIAFLGARDSGVLKNIKWFGGLVSYSGFMFCFGYTAYISYFSKGNVSLRRIFPSVYRPIIAFYISAFCFDLIFVPHPLGLDDVFKTLILWHIPQYSEFLPGFSLTLLISALLVKPILWVTANPRRLLICGILLVSTTLFPYDLIRIPEIGLFFGAPTELGFLFPVLQYFILFLIGVYFSRHAVKASLWLGVLGIAGAVGFWLLNHFRPDYMTRFPPTPGWILGSIPVVLLSYVIARAIDRSLLVRRLVVPIGANSLFYLLVTNILLFGLAQGLTEPSMSVVGTLLATVVLIIAVDFCTTIVRIIKVEPSGSA